MNLAAGAQLGPYEVVGLLGAGAMGEVYQARDHRLRRNVAVKVLPPAFSQDPDRLHRFEHEARAAGALNHPNVLAIHDVGSDGRARYLVSELLEGQTLRSRMADSLVAQRKVVEYAIQIARGLAAAHDKGIVHRDLKPENVFLTRDGGVKILDFGLAKLNWPACLADEGDATESLTEPGTVLGTVGYMSPEQVRGEIVDHRSDIFSLGTILYEMLAGRRPFQGKTAVETMNAILKEEPPRLSDLSPDLPPGLERIASHCLEKNAEERFQSARDLAFDMEALSHPSNPSVRALAHASARRRISLQAAALAAAVVGLPTAGYVARSAPSAIPTYHRLSYRRGVVGSARFSPDGQIVYSAAWEGKPMEAFATRPDLPEARSLGFGDAQVLSVSQPGEVGLILYRDDGRTLFARAPLAGGPPREVAEDVIAADESRDGSRVALLRRVEGRVRLEFPAGHTAYTAVGLSHPRLSPAGDRVAFLEHPLAGDDRGFVSLLDAAGRRTRLSSDYASIEGLAWSPRRDEVWFTAAKVGADSSLYAVDLSGDERLVTRAPGRLVLHDVAADGRVLLQRVAARMEIRALLAGDAADRDLSWLDHSGPAALSPDAKRLLFYESGEGGGPGYAVYIRGTDGSVPIRLGEGRALGLSPDGRWALAMPLSAPSRLVLLPTGAGEPRTVPGTGVRDYHWASFFPDGKRLLVAASEPGHGPRLYVQDVDGSRLRPITPEGIGAGRESLVSPDGRLVVGYASTLEGPRIYPVAGDGDPRPIAGIKAGEVPLAWTADGRGLYVQAGSRRSNKVYRLDLDTGRRELWREIAPADPAGVSWMSLILPTADGKGYIYSYRRMLSELYIVDGLA